MQLSNGQQFVGPFLLINLVSMTSSARYACGNSKLINGILKDELGFEGFVQSDWLAQRSGVASALAGLLVLSTFAV